MLAETTDPDKQQTIQNQINTQQNILSTIQQEINLTPEELTELETQAQTEAEGNPIELETDAGLEWWLDDYIIEGLVTFGREEQSIFVGMAATYNSMIGDKALAQQQYKWAYENGPLGLTKNSEGLFYWGTRGSLAVATGATTTATVIGLFPTMSIGLGRYGGGRLGHFDWTRAGAWWHATGSTLGRFVPSALRGAARRGYGGFWNTLKVPVLSSASATFSGSTANCATGAGLAWWNAGGAVPLIISFDLGITAGGITYIELNTQETGGE